MTQTSNVVYLAGPINGCTDAECKDWREYAKNTLNCLTLDPMRRDYRGKEVQLYKEIVKQDLIDIDNCSIMLVNAPRPSWGTAMEVFYAKHNKGKVIVMVVPEDSVISPWQYNFCDFIYYSIAEACKNINRLC